MLRMIHETFQQLTGLEGKWTGTINYTNKGARNIRFKIYHNGYGNSIS